MEPEQHGRAPGNRRTGSGPGPKAAQGLLPVTEAVNRTDTRHPWTFAAVSVMVIAVTLLVQGLNQLPAIRMLPGYVAAYLLIGACIFGPVGTRPSPRQSVAFLLPGILLVVLAVLDLGLWCGGWLLGLPAWGLLLSRWAPGHRLPVVQVLKFLAVLVLGLVVFMFTGFTLVFFSLAVFLLPLLPIRLAYPNFRAHRLQAGVEVLLAVAAVALALMLPAQEGAWTSPFIHAGGAATAGLMTAFAAGDLPRRSARLRPDNGALV